MDVGACLIDMDGTLYVGNQPVPGAGKALDRLRRAEMPFRLTTNTTRVPRSRLVTRLQAMDFEIQPDEILTAPVAAAEWLRQRELSVVSLVLPEETHEDFAGFKLDDLSAEAVVVGDLGEQWTFERLNSAFTTLRKGARLVAIHKNRFWDPGSGVQLDAGPFVVALEYASGRDAVLVGKPNPAFFKTAAASLSVEPEDVLVVGDNPETDIAGARAFGCHAVAVSTGCFDQSAESALLAGADVLESVADLPSWLGI
jgi:HAD superfamily hydrolase (TIGR01458 family)